MNAGFSDEQMRLAARLYYLDGLGQAEVARFVKVSQAKISRLLTAARERGIVRISVDDYEPRDTALEKRLLKAFPLRAAAVVRTLPSASTEDVRRSTGHFGAAFVKSLVPPGSTVAVAGGRTMRDLAAALPEGVIPDLTLVQAMGSIDSTLTSVDALELGRSMAHRWGGSFIALNTPAFVPDKDTRDAFLALDQLRTVWRRFSTVSVALVGIGTLENSVFVERGILTAADIASLRAAGAVGEIFGRFYDARGRECDTPWSGRVLSMSLAQLKKVPQVIGVVAGADRSAAIAAAVRGGLLNSLLMDDTGARALLSRT